MAQANKAKDLRQKTDEELATFIEEKNEELFKLRFQQFTGQLENTAAIGTVKRELARAKGVLTEKSGETHDRRPRAVRKAERSAS